MTWCESEVELRKSILFQKEVKCLGHLTSEDVVTADPDKIRAVQE